MSLPSDSWCVESSVFYYAVYPDGRRCLVSREDLETFGEQWQLADGCSFVTVVTTQRAPVYGTLERQQA